MYNLLFKFKKKEVAIGFIKRYIVGFWLWWYVVEAKIFYSKVATIWLYTLSFLNVVPMLRHLFEPLYQDYTTVGRVIAFPIRLLWGVTGAVIQIFITIPLIALMLFYLALPILPIIATLAYLEVVFLNL